MASSPSRRPACDYAWGWPSSKALVAKGILAPGVFGTDDCRSTYSELSDRGVNFLSEPAERFYGIRGDPARHSGNWFSMTQRSEEYATRRADAEGGDVAKETSRREREVPRPFEFHWGGGQIIEEAAYVGEHTEPAIQLLEYEGHPGSYGIRFCYYNHAGRFQRSPMMIDSGETLEGLRAALKETPKLRAMLKKLVT